MQSFRIYMANAVRKSNYMRSVKFKNKGDY